MLNSSMKPKKFNIFKNLKNSLNGAVEVFKNETALRVEVYTFTFLTILVLCSPIGFIHKAILILSMPIVIIAEIVNSAIERSVDTATLEYDDNAKKSKDAASTIVLASLVWCATIWLTTLFHWFFLVH